MRKNDVITNNQGFSLLEVALVLAIMAVVVGSTLPMVSLYLKQQGATATNANMKAVEQAIALYAARNNRLPCPALGGNSAQPIGAELGSGRDGTQIPKKCPKTIGLVPWRTLGLEPQYGLDGFARPITYAAHPDMVIGEDLCGEKDEKKLQVFDNKKITLTPNMTLALVLVSHGENGAGVYLGYDSPGRVADASGYEIQNANDDGMFLNMPSINSDETVFDDELRWLTVERLMQLGNQASCNTDDEEGNQEEIGDTGVPSDMIPPSQILP